MNKPLWWREGHEVFGVLKESWGDILSGYYVKSDNEDDEDCIDEQLWAMREGLA